MSDEEVSKPNEASGLFTRPSPKTRRAAVPPRAGGAYARPAARLASRGMPDQDKPGEVWSKVLPDDATKYDVLFWMKKALMPPPEQDRDLFMRPSGKLEPRALKGENWNLVARMKRK